MVRRTFGPLGVPVPVIGQGTWNLERVDKKKAVAALRRGLDIGMTHIDTAEMYGSGLVEEWVGEAIRGRRDEVFLTSKVLPENASYQGTLKACEQSLRRLRTDVLDLYLLHWLGSIPLEETLRAFEQLRGAGKIRHFGVSNFDVGELERAVAVAGKDQIACDQVLYHLSNGGSSTSCCRGVKVIGWRLWGIAHSVPADFPTSRAGEDRCWRRSPRLTARRRAKSRFAS